MILLYGDEIACIHAYTWPEANETINILFKGENGKWCNWNVVALGKNVSNGIAVSYTHLTLPTIYSV